MMMYLYLSTYHKEESADEQKNYVDGKPDYADAFEDNMIFRWDFADWQRCGQFICVRCSEY